MIIEVHPGSVPVGLTPRPNGRATPVETPPNIQ